MAANWGPPAPPRRSSTEVAKYAVLITVAVLCIIPFMWVWSSALKPPAEIVEAPLACPNIRPSIISSKRGCRAGWASTSQQRHRNHPHRLFHRRPLVAGRLCVCPPHLPRPPRAVLYLHNWADPTLPVDHDPPLLPAARPPAAWHLLGDDRSQHGVGAALRHLHHACVLSGTAF